jgi:hypothetical protein
MLRLIRKLFVRLVPCVTVGALVMIGANLTAAQSPGSARDARKRAPDGRRVSTGDEQSQGRPQSGRNIARPSEVANPLAAALRPAEIDLLLEKELEKAGRQLSPVTRDEDFLRRVYLDLTGKLPTPDKLDEFVNDTDSEKRSKVIDTLLNTEDYARNWARYWRDVIRFHAIDLRSQLAAPKFEEWLTEQLHHNVHWDRIATELITAKGKIDEDGRTYLIFSQFDMENTAVNVAAETTRVFMGIQISCAQCHDHPYDEWKREQFHEMAAFFARTFVAREAGDPRTFEVKSKDELARNRPGLAKAAKKKAGPLALEHRMPDKDDPEKSHVMRPTFLLGQKAAEGLSDVERRELFASYVTDKNDPWFARSYVNRIWGELMGEGFYEPVDDLGPGREARFPLLINRLSSAWRASDYDVKWLFRLIMNTQAYQREIRPRDPSAEATPFASVCPTRLSADQIFDSLVTALGIEDSPQDARANYAAARRGGAAGARFQLSREFGIDPSLPNDEIQGTVPQALFLMNSPLLAQKISANGDTMLSRWLSVYSDDDEVITLLYKRVLARAPSRGEQKTCKEYIQQVGDRKEAFEDLLWSLVNSTEFITKR